MCSHDENSASHATKKTIKARKSMTEQGQDATNFSHLANVCACICTTRNRRDIRRLTGVIRFRMINKQWAHRSCFSTPLPVTPRDPLLPFSLSLAPPTKQLCVILRGTTRSDAFLQPPTLLPHKDPHVLQIKHPTAFFPLLSLNASFSLPPKQQARHPSSP